MRDPKTDPRPGDELFGKTLKAKVFSVELTEGGVEKVSYGVAWHGEGYVRKCSVSLGAWSRFVATASTEPPKKDTDRRAKGE